MASTAWFSADVAQEKSPQSVRTEGLVFDVDFKRELFQLAQQTTAYPLL